jgi:hypothetical protein
VFTTCGEEDTAARAESMFLKLWSAAVRQVVSRRFQKEKALQKLYDKLNE